MTRLFASQASAEERRLEARLSEMREAQRAMLSGVVTTAEVCTGSQLFSFLFFRSRHTGCFTLSASHSPTLERIHDIFFLSFE